MKIEEYTNIKRALGSDKTIKYELLSYIEENIITDQYTFNELFPELDNITEKEEIIKLYRFIQKLYYENNPLIYTEDYQKLKLELKKRGNKRYNVYGNSMKIMLLFN